MSTAVAELMLAQGALLNGSWWVARSLRASDGRLIVVGQPDPPAHHVDRHHLP